MFLYSLVPTYKRAQQNQGGSNLGDLLLLRRTCIPGSDSLFLNHCLPDTSKRHCLYFERYRARKKQKEGKPKGMSSLKHHSQQSSSWDLPRRASATATAQPMHQTPKHSQVRSLCSNAVNSPKENSKVNCEAPTILKSYGSQLLHQRHPKST